VGLAGLLAGSNLHHVGIVVADLDAAILNYEALGFGDADRFDIPDQGVRAAFFPLASGSIELIQPTDPEGAIGRFMAKRGEGFHHVAYEVEDLAGTLEVLATAGIELIDFAPRTGGHGLMIAFIHPRACNGVLTELVEKANSRGVELPGESAERREPPPG
jgi:methylmalonyl-CoA/ethylmalonyl-CoA epimerase